MSAYQKMVAKKMALFYRKRDTKGRFLCGKKQMSKQDTEMVMGMAKQIAIKYLQFAIKNLQAD